MFVLALLLTSSPNPSPVTSVQLDARVVPKAGEHVLVGAGDIADCRGTAADATAKIVEAVLARSANALAFTAGDNAYSNGTLEEFRRCYAPTWGRFLERTAPVAGNHEYNTKGAAGYFAYFGKRAGSRETPWRALTKGAWQVLLLDSNCDGRDRRVRARIAPGEVVGHGAFKDIEGEVHRGDLASPAIFIGPTRQRHTHRGPVEDARRCERGARRHSP